MVRRIYWIIPAAFLLPCCGLMLARSDWGGSQRILEQYAGYLDKTRRHPVEYAANEETESFPSGEELARRGRLRDLAGLTPALRQSTHTMVTGCCPDPLVYGAPNRHRILDALRHASSISIAAHSERVCGVPCVVVRAQTPMGKLRVCFDPTHDYCIAKYTAERDGALHPDTLSRDERGIVEHRVLSFEQVAGIWVPDAAEMRSRVLRKSDGSVRAARRQRLQRLEPAKSEVLRYEARR